MAKYIVNVIVSACVQVEVEAHNEEEAQDIALESVDPTVPDEWSYEVDSVGRDWEDYWDEVGEEDDEEEEDEE